MDLEKTRQNLELRGFKVSFFDTGKEAAAHIASQISGCTVGFGGSKTLACLKRSARTTRYTGTGRRPGRRR